VSTAQISSRGHQLDTSPHAYGELRRSEDAIDDPVELTRRLTEDGYLFLPGYLDRDEVLAARHDLLARLDQLRRIAPGTDPDDGRAVSEFGSSLLPELAHESQPLKDLLYSGRMVNLFQRIFGEPIRHFDFTWFRAYPPGPATALHMDSVFMNRGTLDLLTAWTPLGDIERRLGGLAVLEQSHKLEELKNDYGSRDVDTYCSNHERAENDAIHDGLLWDGSLADNPAELREALGGRWLTTDFRAGDLLTFTIFTVHCGLDNNADRLRLSCDSRYQPASQPADPRWIGVHPSAHSSRSKRGTIC
jgi:hypothetical protein